MLRYIVWQKFRMVTQIFALWLWKLHLHCIWKCLFILVSLYESSLIVYRCVIVCVNVRFLYAVDWLLYENVSCGLIGFLHLFRWVSTYFIYETGRKKVIEITML